MNDANQTMTRYLLGELSESEQTAFEAAYFEDPRILTEVTETEEALIDDYVRGRLSPDLRQRFERVYLGDAPRRERVDFARALVARLDGVETTRQTATREADGSAATPGWFASLFGATPALRWSLAVVLLGIASAGMLWLYRPSSRVPEMAGPAPSAPIGPGAPNPPVAPVVVAPSAPIVLALTVGPGVRSGRAGSPVSLVIPSSASEVQIDLSLDDPDHNRFALMLRKVGGAEILRRDNLRRASSGPAFSLVIPADRLTAGDYLLTMQGAQGGDALEDLSQTLIRVDRPR